IGGKKKGKQTKRKRNLLDEADDEQPRSPPAAPVPQEANDEEILLSAPQPSQPTQTSQSSNMLLMPTLSVQRKEPSCSAFPDFDYPNFDPEPEPKIAIRPRSISEAKTRLQLRQLQSTTIGTRAIRFVGDASGVSEPSNLPFLPKKLQWKGKNAIAGNHLNKQRLAKLKAKKGNGKKQT
ncbi:hypothetical protein A4A49_59021, partial [Nicotiana attenuata]